MALDALKWAFITHHGLRWIAWIEVGQNTIPYHSGRIVFDDVLVCSQTFKEQLTHLDKQVLSWLWQAGLYLKSKKGLFLPQKVPYLGHILKSNGVLPDPAKTDKVMNFPVPTDMSQVCQFLGVAPYYRRFVPEFAWIASPLHALLKKGTVFSWTSHCEDAFSRIGACPSVGLSTIQQPIPLHHGTLRVPKA